MPRHGRLLGQLRNFSGIKISFDGRKDDITLASINLTEAQNNDGRDGYDRYYNDWSEHEQAHRRDGETAQKWVTFDTDLAEFASHGRIVVYIICASEITNPHLL